MVVATLLLAGSACSDEGQGDGAVERTTTTTAAAPSPYADYTSALYADDAAWLCRPGLADDVCHRDLDASAVAADGAATVEPHVAAVDAPVDCFYVYPTTSFDPGPNSDLVPGEDAEINTVYNQAARFTSVCRVFAPIYRQATLSMIGGGVEVPAGVDPRQIAYDDVVDAFKHYIANESDGRGFVLMGHSQGAGILRRLIEEEIDDQPALRDRLVSALLLGSTVAVPVGEAVGGDFANVPLCAAPGDLGCVVSYASFRSDAPPPESTFFARTSEAGMEAACVTPAGLGSGAVELEPYYLMQPGGLLGGATEPYAEASRSAEVTTPWVSFPGLVEAECVRSGDFHYLALTVRADAADPRTDDIGGDLTPEWGMHLVDVNVAMGNLVDLVDAQGRAYSG